MPSLPAVLSRGFLGLTLASVGQFAAATAVAQQAVRIAEAGQDPLSLTLAQVLGGVIYLRQGDAARARSLLERSLDVARRRGFELGSLMAAGPLGEARAACGATAEALALLEQAAAQAASISFVPSLREILGALGATYLLTGRLAEARHAAERLLRMARASGKRPSEAEALRMLAELHARVNPTEFSQAAPAYREALSIAEQIGARPLAAHCHLGLGKLYRRMRDHGPPQEQLTTATMYREMHMRFWVERSETEMRELA
jgi:tetratricopeptide (TPR) repeat protein